MSGVASTPEVLIREHGCGGVAIIDIQCQYYIRHQECDFPECRVELFYMNNGGEDDTACFRATSCKNWDHFPPLCCTVHKDVHVCEKCREEEEPVHVQKRTVEEVEEENQRLKEELERLKKMKQ